METTTPLANQNTEIPHQEQPNHPVQPPRNNFSLLIIAVIGMLLIVAGAAGYYLGLKNANPWIEPAPNNESTACTLEAKICPDGSTVGRVGPNCEFEECSNNDDAKLKKEIDWISQTVEVERETEINGEETISLTFQYPSNWKYQTAIKRPNSDYLGNDCVDYELLDETDTRRLLIRPICDSWTATYSNRPLDAVVVKQQGQTRNDGETTDIVRYFDSLSNEYHYVETDADKVTDAILIHSKESNRFLPVYIRMPLTSEENIDWTIPDAIVNSLAITIN